MPTVLLVRHGRTAANVNQILSGRSSGVDLDETGIEQARALRERLRGLDLADVVTSPLERCVQTAGYLVSDDRQPTVDERLNECDYGDWTGKTGDELRQDPLWATVQRHPSAVVFPGGESLRAVQARAVDSVRDHNDRLAAEFGSDVVWTAVSHADVIKSIVADALGMHLDLFQRLVIDNCAVSAISYGDTRPAVLTVNNVGTLPMIVSGKPTP